MKTKVIFPTTVVLNFDCTLEIPEQGSQILPPASKLCFSNMIYMNYLHQNHWGHSFKNRNSWAHTPDLLTKFHKKVWLI